MKSNSIDLDSIWIFPNIYYREDYHEEEKERSFWEMYSQGSKPQGEQVKDESKLQSLIEKHRLIVLVGDAGLGKSYVINHLSQSLAKEKLPTFKLIEQSANSLDAILLNYDGDYILLDALDETKNEEFLQMIFLVKQFALNHESPKVIISCRDYIFDRYADNLVVNNILYLHLDKFDYWKVERYLKEAKFSAEEVEQILERFSNLLQVQVINIPRILRIFTELAKADFGGTLQMTKAELFEAIIYKMLQTEENKAGGDRSQLIKRIAEVLALVMHINGQSEIGKEDFIIFLEDVNNRLASSFLHQVRLDEFTERYIIRVNSENNSYYFENNDFRDYLAAKEITRLGRIDQVAYDLAFNTELNEFLPVWFKTLDFLVQLNPDLLVKIIDFISKRSPQSAHDESLITQILSGEKGVVEKLTITQRSEVFQKVIRYYHFPDAILWLYSISARLILYYHETDEAFLKYLFEKATLIRQRANILRVVIAVYQKGLPIDEKCWRDKAFEIADTGIKRHGDVDDSILLLGLMKDIRLLKKIYKPKIFNNPEGLYDSIAKAFIKADPNNKTTIDLIVKGFANDYFHTIPNPTFNQINSESGVYNAFRAILKYLNELLGSHSFLKKDFFSYDFLEAVKRNLTARVKSVIIQILNTEKSQHYIREYFEDLLLAIREADSNFLKEWLEQRNEDLWYEYLSLVHLVDEKNIDWLIAFLKKRENGQMVLYHLYKRLEDQNKTIARKIAPHIQMEIKRGKQSYQEYLKKEEKSRKNTYKDFQKELEQGSNNLASVLWYFAQWKETVKEFWSSGEKRKLRKLAIEALTKLDRFRLSNEVIDITDDLDIDLAKYRIQIARSLPYYSGFNDFEKWVKLVENPTEEEIEAILEPFINEDNDDFIRKYNRNFKHILDSFEEHIPKKIITKILKRIVDHEKIEIWYKLEAFESLMKSVPDYAYCKNQFEKYKDLEGEDRRLAEDANKYLILSNLPQYQREAVAWRMDEIKSRINHYTKVQELPRNHEDVERKLDYFDYPLVQIANQDLLKVYLEFFNYGTALFAEGAYYHYADYVWQIVIKYVNQLRVYKNINPYRKIENLINQHELLSKDPGLQRSLAVLKQEYIEVLQSNITFPDCIKKYNYFKEKQYLPVATSEDLLQLVLDIIDKDLKERIEEEGYYAMLQKIPEPMISKSLKLLFHNCMIDKGFRPKDLDIGREEELIDEKRTDYIIRYGLCGKIMVELKKTNNPEVTNEVKREEYKSKMNQYITGSNSDFGIYLLFQVDEKHKLDKYLDIHKKLYERENKISVRGLKCVLS